MNGLGHFDQSQCWSSTALAFTEDCIKMIGNQSLFIAKPVHQGTPYQVKILPSAKFQADPLQRILQVPPKSSFKHLLLETLLWQYVMSLNLKSPSEGLKNAEWKKGMLPVRLPIPYVPPTASEVELCPLLPWYCVKLSWNIWFRDYQHVFYLEKVIFYLGKDYFNLISPSI